MEHESTEVRAFGVTTYGQCFHCNALYDTDGSFILNIKSGKFERLIWDQHGCYFFNHKGEHYKMPWLPFDITEERLKLLLTFS